MASENLAKLQATVNRFAGAIGQAPLVPDGGMGDLTFQGVQFALMYAIQNDPAAPDSVDHRVLESLSRLSETPEGQMQNVITLNEQLTRVADKLGLARPQSISVVRPPIPGATPDPGAFKVKPPPTGVLASLSVTWHKLPTWAQIGIGAGAVFGTFALATSVKKKPMLPPGEA